MRKRLVMVALFGLALAPAGWGSVAASPVGPGAIAPQAPEPLIQLAQIGGAGGGGHARVAPRAVAPRAVAPRVVGPGRVVGGGPGTFNRNVTVNRNVVINRNIVRTGPYRGGRWAGGAWVRPGWYRWRPGGAIIAGAAIGFVAAGAAYAWAGDPPAPGYCWYYTDPSQQDGFWDVCP